MSTFNYGVAINAVTHPSVYRATRAMASLSHSIHQVERGSNSAWGARNASRMERWGGSVVRAFDSANAGAGRLLGTLFSVQSLMLGTTVGFGLGVMVNEFSKTALAMEGIYARLLTSFGGNQAKVLETLAWAKQKAVETPFDLMEVNQVVERMAATGILGDTKEQREKNFTSVGDFAAAKRINPIEAANMAAKSGMGNYEQLADNTGLQPSTMMANAMAAPITVRKELMELATIINTTKRGTKVYKQAVIDFLGLWGKGGMENQMQTITGKLSNIRDLWENFKISLVGITQVEGTLSNRIMKGLGGFLDKFNEVQQTNVYLKDGKTLWGQYNQKLSEKIRLQMESHGFIVKEITMTDRLFQLGERMGNALITVWEAIAGRIKGGTNVLVDHINKMNVWFSDFKNNIAPIILVLAIYKIRLEKIWDGFKKGFTVFKYWLGVLKAVGQTLWTYILKPLSEWVGKGDVYKGMGMIMGVVTAGILAWNLGLRKTVTLLIAAVKQVQDLGDGINTARQHSRFPGKRWYTPHDPFPTYGGGRPMGRRNRQAPAPVVPNPAQYKNPAGPKPSPGGPGSLVVSNGPPKRPPISAVQRRRSASAQKLEAAKANARNKRMADEAAARKKREQEINNMPRKEKKAAQKAEGFGKYAPKNENSLLGGLGGKWGMALNTLFAFQAMGGMEGIKSMKPEDIVFNIGKFVTPLMPENVANAGTLAESNALNTKMVNQKFNSTYTERSVLKEVVDEGTKLNMAALKQSEKNVEMMVNRLAGGGFNKPSINLTINPVINKGSELDIEQIMERVHRYVASIETRSGNVDIDWKARVGLKGKY